jgi:GNAT superfamily N-acetyltransferase
MINYKIIPSLERANLFDYAKLFSEAFVGEGKLTAEYLNWLYFSNPHGGVIGFDAFLEGDLVAHYAVIPRVYYVANQRFFAALSLNTATHPSHQGKGLFIKLAEATYNAAALRGVQFVIGVANGKSIGGFTRRLGFSQLGQIRLYPGFKAPLASNDSLSLSIDHTWLKWRLANPSRKYQYIRHSDATCTLLTRLKGIPFLIGRVENASVVESSVPAVIGAACVIPGLAPVFDVNISSIFRLPLKAQPSPWHVIWRTLDSNVDHSLSEQLRIDGLAMDTF